MTPKDLKEKIRIGENETTEFKNRISDPNILTKNIAAFANANGGKIFIGIGEPNIIVGTDFIKTKQIYERAIKSLNPKPSSKIEKIEVENNEVAIITVEKANELIFSNGGLFKRIGEQISSMHYGEIARKISTNHDENSFISLAKSLEEQTSIIESLNSTIQSLKISIEKKESWSTKLKDHFISGLIGGIIGIILGLIAKSWFNV